MLPGLGSPLVALLAAATLAVTPAVASAAAEPSTCTAGIATAATVLPTTVPADWVLTADRLALEYAASMRWPDRCSAFSWDVLDDADAQMGMDVEAFATVSRCHFSLDVAVTADPVRFCGTFVHERLHLVRQDGWHDPAPGSPLYPYNVGYVPCQAAYSRPAAPDWLTRSEVRALLERRLGDRWRVKVLEHDVKGDELEAIVRARRAIRRLNGGRVLVRERLDSVRQQQSGDVAVEFIDGCVRTLRWPMRP
jgi:hypothetical protein